MRRKSILSNIMKNFLKTLSFLGKLLLLLFKYLFQILRKIPYVISQIPKYYDMVRKITKKFNQDECMSYAAQLAFNLVLALFPGILLIVTSLSFVQSPKTILLLSDLIGDVLPKEIQVPINTAIADASKSAKTIKSGGTLLISMFFASLSSISCFLTVIKSMNEIYKVDTKMSVLQKYKTSIKMLFIVGFAIFILLNVLIAGYKTEVWLYDIFRTRFINKLFNILQYPIALVVIVITTSLIYKFSLNINQKIRNLIPGSVLVATMFIPITIWFGDYMENQLYGTVYKTLAKLIAIPIFMYANAMIFYIGAELNSYLYKPNGKEKNESFLVQVKNLFTQNFQSKT